MRLDLALVLATLLTACATPPVQGPADELAPDRGAETAAAGGLAAREVAFYALSLVGSPYRFGGDSRDTGFDCSGLIWRIFREAAGINLPRDAQGLSRVGVPVGPLELQPGDLVFFNTRRRSYSHVGVYVGASRFVHAPSERGLVEVGSMAERYWRTRFDGARRLSF